MVGEKVTGSKIQIENLGERGDQRQDGSIGGFSFLKVLGIQRRKGLILGEKGKRN